MDPQCRNGVILDTDREESFSFNIEPKVGEEQQELGGVYFEPVVIDSAREQMEEEAGIRWTWRTTFSSRTP